MATTTNDLSIKQVADLIKSGAAGKRVVFLLGAGISVAASLPDFRSAGGLYDTLRPELLTASDRDRQIMKDDPTWVVNKDLFTRNQFPYMEVRRPFILGTASGEWKPTAAHFAVSLFEKKGLLQRVYTQNIDSLDFKPALSIPQQKLVSVHGTIAQVRCEACGKPGPDNGSIDAFAKLVKQNIRNIYDPSDESAPKESKNICCEHCGKPQLKPSTVLYGGAMPDEFFEATEKDFSPVRKEGDVDTTPDLMFCVGSSLTVFPAAGLPNHMRGKPVVVVNRDRVSLREPPFAIISSDIDEAFVKLCCELGWAQDIVKCVDPQQMAPKSIETVKRVVAEFDKQSDEEKRQALL